MLFCKSEHFNGNERILRYNKDYFRDYKLEIRGYYGSSYTLLFLISFLKIYLFKSDKNFIVYKILKTYLQIVALIYF